ncbi:MAG TPA: hypothetical protein VFD56_12995, partial [Chitinophagaceae bacterium]|nr:hypothetical protein [Chitinophagaceae bacterium]
MLTRFDHYKQLFFAAFFLLLPALLFSQTKTIDSLLLALRNARHDTSKILLNFQLAEKLRGYDLERAMKHVEAGHAIGKNLDNGYYNAY